jgi:hypothetical protein
MDPEAKPEFQQFSETDVQTALENPDAQNAIAIEVGRLVAAYALDLRDRPAVPADQVPQHARYPIEAVALRLATKLAGLPVVKDGA